MKLNLRTLLTLAVLLLGASPSWGAREFQSLLFNGHCEGATQGAYDSKTRIRVMLRNLSSRTQSIKVFYQDLRFLASAAFGSASDASATLPNWTAGDPKWRKIGGHPADTIFPGPGANDFTDIPPNGALEVNYSFQCFFENSKTNCVLVNSESPAIFTDKIIYTVHDTSFSVKIVIKDDLGAVSAGLFVSNLCNHGANLEQNSQTILLNGGRPF